MAYEKWDDNPGGEIVTEYTENGVTYVEVRFKNSPDKVYTYVKD